MRVPMIVSVLCICIHFEQVLGAYDPYLLGARFALSTPINICALCTKRLHP